MLASSKRPPKESRYWGHPLRPRLAVGTAIYRAGPVDPSLTLTRTQHPAITGNRGNRIPLIYAEFANPCNAQKRPTAHS